MKTIIIPETDNRGIGKIKFTLNEEGKIFYEILDKKKSIANFGLEFRIHEGNHIKKEIREAQTSLIRKICRANPKDKEYIISLKQKEEISEEDTIKNYWKFQGFITDNFSDAVITVEEIKDEILEKFHPNIFRLLLEAFQNDLLINFVPS